MESLEQNRTHYQDVYARVRAGDVVRAARAKAASLDRVIQVHTSWAGLYMGGFQHRLDGARVLELGAGDGVNALVMASLGARVVAIDIAEASAALVEEAARGLGVEDRVQALTGDFAVMKLPPGSFDFVVGKAFLHHLDPEQEGRYLRKAAEVLRPEGEARFLEPACNSLVLDRLRTLVPVPGRPSALARRAYAEWLANDPHPVRDNSSWHYLEAARRYFGHVEATPLGALERFHRLLPRGRMNHAFRRWALRAERRFPAPVRLVLARSQTLVFREPLAARSAGPREAVAR
ncbi:MAG TPA: class I SAM-dependent methyltransferase [Longimicrobium sp.]|nr:class I SAM-dependent methyltransferase [Longimicrobium sp.]